MMIHQKHSADLGFWGLLALLKVKRAAGVDNSTRLTSVKSSMVCQHSNYHGPVGVIVSNLGEALFEVVHGMRIAQMVVAPVTKADFAVVETLDETLRGAGGFGSTLQ